MNVLIAVTTYPEPPFVHDRTKTSIEALQWDDPLTVRYIGDDDMELEPMDRLVVKHNRIREMVINEGFDAWLSIEADVIVPPDALTKLVEVDADVVYGTYVSRHHNMVLCFPRIDGYSARSISADVERWRDKWGGAIQSEGVGFGCTLIRRNVLEAVPFRRKTDKPRERLFADDWTWALDVQRAGFKSAHHLGVLCGHIADDGRVLWPDVSSESFVRVEGGRRMADKPVKFYNGEYEVIGQIWHGGENKYYQVGETIHLTADKAEILFAKRAVRPMEQQPVKRAVKKDDEGDN